VAKKLQGFFILKLSTDRLKISNYKINITLEEARRNNELVTLGDSELLRKIREIREQTFSQEILDLLMNEKHLLLRKRNTPENRKKIREICDRIDSILFVEDLIVLNIVDVRHYKKIIENGLRVNGVTYYRLLCGAGHARRSSVVFCSEEIIYKLYDFLDCGRDTQELINPNKFNAYHALASSATLPVSRPNFVVIPDCEVNRMTKVDWFIPQEDGVDPTFEEKEIEQKINLFDGQGLISPTQARIWADDLEISWLPSAFIFRTAFSKGLLVTFDFHSFAREHGIRKIIDIYGEEHLVDDIEVILSLSQFKMASFYKNLTDYNQKCKENNFGWGITRYTPEKDKEIANTTYQYLQAMNISDEKIEKICAPTLEWLNNISGLSWEDASLFLLGERSSISEKEFSNLDYLTKAILLEPSVLSDLYIRKKILGLINKKIRESYIGILKVKGNYQFLVSDPYAQCQHAFGVPVTGDVNKGYAYSQYWQKKRIEKVSCFRSPMTWRSEHVVLNIDKNEHAWYDYQYSNIVFNIHDDWMMRLSGADVDGDIVMTTPEFTDCHYEDLNIPTYDRKNAQKIQILRDELWQSDTLSFGTKIGLITNFGTTFFSMLPQHVEPEEQELLINRLKTCNVSQNMQIDRAKGIQTYPLPTWWDKWNKDGENSDIYNKILCDKRPYFMRYVYSSHNKKYRHHISSYENISLVRFGFSLSNLLEMQNLTDEQQKIKEEFYSRSPLIDSPSIMNNLCHHMEENAKEIKHVKIEKSVDYHIYMNRDFEFDKNKIDKMEFLYLKWVSFLRNSHDRPVEEDDETEMPTKDEFIRVLEREAYDISSNISELTNLLVYVCYVLHPKASKDFAWRMFNGKGIIDNLIERCNGYMNVPVLDEAGTHEYLGRKYGLSTLVLETRDA
jgi:hypothetical protein